MSKQKHPHAQFVPETPNVKKWDFKPPSKVSFTPMYFQIQTQLMTMIQSGCLRSGDPLPSVEKLSSVYGVSRMISRQALQALTRKGFASSQKGQRRFVSQPQVEKDITHLGGFTAEMRMIDMKASSRVLSSKMMTPI